MFLKVLEIQYFKRVTRKSQIYERQAGASLELQQKLLWVLPIFQLGNPNVYYFI